MKIPHVNWFRQIWLSAQKRWAVLAAYKSIDELALADIALRGHVFSSAEVRGDVHATLVNVGRQQLALEIIELARVDVHKLFNLIERKPERESSS